MSKTQNDFILRFRAPDQPGIIAKVAPTLADAGCDIREAGIYGDPESHVFFVRMRLKSLRLNQQDLEAAFTATAEDLRLDWAIYDYSIRPRIVIAVSKFDHCLNDLLHKWRAGSLPVDIRAIVSNHPDLASTAERHDIAYHYLPISKDTKAAQEAAFQNIIDETGAELTVLARYMQILSDDFSQRLAGKCINIHHSFLPSFKGARPYHQAHKRGVKLIGATAHYVTADLDEGPIIEQDVRRVNHAYKPQEMVQLGHEVESSVLSRAVKWHAERRVFLNGSRTVIL